MLRRVDFEPFGRGHSGCGDGAVGQDRSLRLACATASRDNQRVAVVHWERSGPWQPAVARYDPCGAQRVEEALPGWRGEALVDRCDGTTLVPGGAQLLDERLAAWQVYCDEVGHIG